MTTAFQSNAFQNNAFQIDAQGPAPRVLTDGWGGPGIQWVSLEDAERLREVHRRRDKRLISQVEERAEVRRIMDEVIAGPKPVEARTDSVPLVEPPQEGFDPAAWAGILDELRDIRRRQQDEDDVDVMLLTMH